MQHAPFEHCFNHVTGESTELREGDQLLLLANDPSDAVRVALAAAGPGSTPEASRPAPPQAVLLLVGPPGAPCSTNTQPETTHSVTAFRDSYVWDILV